MDRLCFSLSVIQGVNHLLKRSRYSSTNLQTMVLSSVRDGTQGLELQRWAGGIQVWLDRCVVCRICLHTTLTRFSRFILLAWTSVKVLYIIWSRRTIPFFPPSWALIMFVFVKPVAWGPARLVLPVRTNSVTSMSHRFMSTTAKLDYTPSSHLNSVR